MLEKKDFQQIGKIVEESIDNTVRKTIKPSFDDVYKRLDGMDKDITHIRTNMATKDFMDEKMADLRGDIVVLLRKEDRKLEALIEKLNAKHVITDNDVKELRDIQIFAQ